MHRLTSPDPRRRSWRASRGGIGLPISMIGWLVVCSISVGFPAFADAASEGSGWRKQSIPILATTFDRQQRPVGVVAEIEVRFKHREDRNGMDVRFESSPGRFSRRAQIAVSMAIRNIARAAHLNTDSWTVSLSVPYKGVTIYGESLSGMVGLTVVALSRGDIIQPQRVLTGTIEPDGRIGAVSGIGLKLEAARDQHLRRVLVPEEYDVTDSDWSTPFLLHVSPVSTFTRAYQVLTDRPFPISDR